MLSPDYNTIVSALMDAYPPGAFFEVRSLAQHTQRSKVGYFNDPASAANAVCGTDDDGVAGFYTTLNPVLPDCYARMGGRIAPAIAGQFTKDKEILSRHQFLVDIDPKRISGVSATDEEHDAAIRYAFELDLEFQRKYGFPPASIIDSGNGAHLRYRTATMPNDESALMLQRKALAIIDKLYSTETLEIDKGNFNASRIARLPGTPARKGDNTLTRKHRVSSVLRPYDPFALLTLGRLSGFVEAHESVLGPGAFNGHKGPVSYPADENIYRSLNAVAKSRIYEWVPNLLGDMAVPSGDGFRVRSRDLGRDLEEDISITPSGIKDFGVHDMGDATEGRRTPLQLLTELRPERSKAEWAEQLSKTLDTPINEFVGKALLPPSAVATMPTDLMGLAPVSLNFTDFADINATDFDDPEYLVEDMLVEEQYVNVIGYAKSGKSTWARQLSVSVISGLDFAGHKTKQGEVLYIGYEETASEFKRNINATLDWMLDKQETTITDEDRQAAYRRLKVLSLGSRIKGADNKEQRQKVAENDASLPTGESMLLALREILDNNPNIRLIVIDPRAVLFRTRMNRDVLTADRLEGEEIRKVIAGSSAVIVTVDHSKKSGGGAKASMGDVTENTSGTGQRTASATTTIGVYRGWQDDGGQEVCKFDIRGRGIASIEKYYYFDAPYGWTPVPDGVNVTLRTDKDGWKRRDSTLPLKLLTVLEVEGPKTREYIAGVLGVSDATAYRELDRLVKSGQIEKLTYSQPYLYKRKALKGLGDVL